MNVSSFDACRGLLFSSSVSDWPCRLGRTGLCGSVILYGSAKGGPSLARPFDVVQSSGPALFCPKSMGPVLGPLPLDALAVRNRFPGLDDLVLQGQSFVLIAGEGYGEFHRVPVQPQQVPEFGVSLPAQVF